MRRRSLIGAFDVRRTILMANAIESDWLGPDYSQIFREILYSRLFHF